MAIERIIIFGASRGLGAALSRVLAMKEPSVLILGVGRKVDLLRALEEELGSAFQGKPMDLASSSAYQEMDALIREFHPTRVFYIAGGGPYGEFGKKNFESQQWAWRVTFEGAAAAAHLLVGMKIPLVLCGSSVCENAPDPQGPAYSAAKHALFGLFRSLNSAQPDWDLRLFSPGYMDTEMIPAGAKVRERPLWQAEDVARTLVAWSLDGKAQCSHLALPLFPG